MGKPARTTSLPSIFVPLHGTGERLDLGFVSDIAGLLQTVTSLAFQVLCQLFQLPLIHHKVVFAENALFE